MVPNFIQRVKLELSNVDNKGLVNECIQPIGLLPLVVWIFWDNFYKDLYTYAISVKIYSQLGF